MLDPISEMLTRIRNAQRAGLKEVSFGASKLKLAIAKILEKEGFIEFVSKEKSGSNKENIKLGLKYYSDSRTKKSPAISGIERKSREGQRIYVGREGIKKVKNNYGISIISTSKGVMTGEEARRSNLGGEYICEVW